MVGWSISMLVLEVLVGVFRVEEGGKRLLRGLDWGLGVWLDCWKRLSMILDVEKEALVWGLGEKEGVLYCGWLIGGWSCYFCED